MYSVRNPCYGRRMETEYVTADETRVGRVKPGRCKVVTNHGKPYAVILAWADYEPVHSLIDLYRQNPPSELRLSHSDLAAHAVTESRAPDTEEDLSDLR